jgi:hypothetical protein
LVASSVEAFIAQRLVRVICPHCKEVDSEPMEDIRREMAQALGNVDPDDITIYRGRGCDQCNQTGYRGRTAIYEILELTESIRSAILEKPRAEHIKQIALREGMTTLRQDGWKNVIAGVTTPMEVMNVTVKETQVSRVLDAVRRDRSKAFKSHEPIERAALKPKETAYLNPKKKLPSSLKKTPEGLPASAKKALYEFRAYPRVMEEVKVSYIVTQPDKEDPTILHTLDKESTGVTRDVSAGGLKFAAPEMISVGTILEFKIFLEADSEPIECLAKVCRIEEDNMSKSFLVSIYFMDITSLERTRLSHFVKSRMAMLVE